MIVNVPSAARRAKTASSRTGSINPLNPTSREAGTLDDFRQDCRSSQRTVQPCAWHTHPFHGRADGGGFGRERRQGKVNPAKPDRKTAAERLTDQGQFPGMLFDFRSHLPLAIGYRAGIGKSLHSQIRRFRCNGKHRLVMGVVGRREEGRTRLYIRQRRKAQVGETIRE